MGQPSAPTIYQQPSQQEIAANQASNQQKQAALAKLNQATFAESRGLRGMGGLYEWSGPTPDLAANMTAANMWRKPAPDVDTNINRAPGGSPGTAQGSPRNTDGVPPAYPIFGTSQGAPVNTGAVPGAAMALPGTSQGAPRNTDAVAAAVATNPSYPVQAFNKATGSSLTVKPGPIIPNPAALPASAAKTLTAAGMPVQATPPASTPPPAAGVYAQQVAQQAGLIQPQAPSAPSTPPPVSVAPATQAPIAPVKPLVTTPQPKPLSNIAYQTTVKPSLYQTTGQAAPRNR